MFGDILVPRCSGGALGYLITSRLLNENIGLRFRQTSSDIMHQGLTVIMSRAIIVSIRYSFVHSKGSIGSKHK